MLYTVVLKSSCKGEVLWQSTGYKGDVAWENKTLLGSSWPGNVVWGSIIYRVQVVWDIDKQLKKYDGWVGGQTLIYCFGYRSTKIHIQLGNVKEMEAPEHHLGITY